MMRDDNICSGCQMYRLLEDCLTHEQQSDCLLAWGWIFSEEKVWEGMTSEEDVPNSCLRYLEHLVLNQSSTGKSDSGLTDSTVQGKSSEAG